MTNKQIKILHITPDFNYCCGRSKHVYLLLRALKENGFEVSLATNGGDSMNRIKLLGIPVYISEFDKDNKSVTKLMKSIISLDKIIKQNNFNIIHTHHRYAEMMVMSVPFQKPCQI